MDQLTQRFGLLPLLPYFSDYRVKNKETVHFFNILLKFAFLEWVKAPEFVPRTQKPVPVISTVKQPNVIVNPQQIYPPVQHPSLAQHVIKRQPLPQSVSLHQSFHGGPIGGLHTSSKKRNGILLRLSPIRENYS